MFCGGLFSVLFHFYEGGGNISEMQALSGLKQDGW